jgi:TatD DNase family protein
MFDTHAHLDFSDYDSDRKGVLERARAAGVDGILTIGIDLASSLNASRLAAEHDWIEAAAAIHPNSAGRPESAQEFTEIRERVLRGEFAAVGETGIDLYRDRTPPGVQEDFFRRHVELAIEAKKPLIIHCRDGHREIERILSEYGGKTLRAVLHCFGSPPESAARFVAMGLYISFAGNVTYKNAHSLREAAALVPLDRLLSETDCPFLAPVPLRGKRNEPALMTHTVDCLAECKGVGRSEMIAHLDGNARRFLFDG